MSKQSFKLCAVGCCALYLLAFLFLPFVALRVVGIGITGIHCFSVNAISYLPLIAGIAMAVCSLALHGKTAGIVNACGALIPLIVFFPFRDMLVGDGLALAGAVIPGLGSAVSGMTSAMIAQILTVGAGVILSLIAGGVAATLCFLSENARKPAETTPGLGASPDDDW